LNVQGYCSDGDPSLSGISAQGQEALLRTARHNLMDLVLLCELQLAQEAGHTPNLLLDRNLYEMFCNAYSYILEDLDTAKFECMRQRVLTDGFQIRLSRLNRISADRPEDHWATELKNHLVYAFRNTAFESKEEFEWCLHYCLALGNTMEQVGQVQPSGPTCAIHCDSV
jgi:hypothetical protein